MAHNAYGDSLVSLVGSGALIQAVPAAPVSLTNNATQTTASKIGFYWSDGATNNGAAVIDYSVFYDQGTGTSNWVLLASGATNRFYLTQVTLN